MNRFNIIPTPKSIVVEGSKTEWNVQSVYIEEHLRASCREAVKFLPDYRTETPEKADLVITDRAERADGLDLSFFKEPLAKEQGYIIKSYPKGRTVIYAPSVQGIMYGICSFVQIEKGAAGFEIKDYPDFRYRSNKWLVWAETGIWSYDFGDGKEAFLSRMERKLDLCLRYKINMIFFDACGPDTERSPHYKELMKTCTALARKRGIHLIFCAYTMGYGLSGHPFGKFHGKVYQNKRDDPHGEVYDCLGTFIQRPGEAPQIKGRSYGTCISNDAMNEDKIAELCNFIREVNPGALYLHNMDSCFVDQALWNARCPACRKKWPNDDLFAKDGMAGAFAYYFDKINGALRSVQTEDYDSARDLIIFNVAPGYLEPKVPDERVRDAAKFWAAVRSFSAVKQNTLPLFRELYYNQSDDRLRVPEVLKEQLGEDFGIVSFAGSDGFYSDKPITLAAKLSYMFKGAKAVLCCSGNAFSEPLGLINAQYMWNSETGKTDDIPTRYETFIPFFTKLRIGEYRPEEVFVEEGLLETVCQKLYGENGGRMFEFFTLRGKKDECPVLFPCNKELGTAANSVLLDYRWDHPLSKAEIEAYVERFEEIDRLNLRAKEILSGCKNDPDIQVLYESLCDTVPLVRLLYHYTKLYARAAERLTSDRNDPSDLLKEADELMQYAAEQRELPFEAIDTMGGAHARRKELFETIGYNLYLIKCSLNSGKRIPEEAKALVDENWW